MILIKFCDAIASRIITASRDQIKIEDIEFASVVDNAMNLIPSMTEELLATKFTCSKPAIRRWRLGKTAPHYAVRVPVFQFIYDESCKQIAKGKQDDAGRTS